MLDGADRLFRLAFLDEAHQRVDENHGEDHPSVGVVPDGRHDHDRAEQDLEKKVLELRQ